MKQWTTETKYILASYWLHLVYFVPQAISIYWHLILMEFLATRHKLVWNSQSPPCLLYERAICSFCIQSSQKCQFSKSKQTKSTTLPDYIKTCLTRENILNSQISYFCLVLYSSIPRFYSIAWSARWFQAKFDFKSVLCKIFWAAIKSRLEPRFWPLLKLF